MCTLPEEFTPEWDKQLLGNQMAINVANLLESGNGWQCQLHVSLPDSSTYSVLGNVPGLSAGLATLSMVCGVCDRLVSLTL